MDTRQPAAEIIKSLTTTADRILTLDDDGKGEAADAGRYRMTPLYDVVSAQPSVAAREIHRN